jgi:hypothetical protein
MGFINLLKSSFLFSIIVFLIIILIINLILIGTGHFDSEPEEGKEKIKRDIGNTLTDGIYFTTTQFSTIGYGDLTPKTSAAKWICSFNHLLIISISLKLISEFGIKSTIDKEVENATFRSLGKNPPNIIERKVI